MKLILTVTLATLALATPVLAAGDVAKGESEFKKCKACHMIVAADGTEIVKGGKTGPNLWNVVGRKPASVADFKYGDGILAMAAKNPDMVWTDADLMTYVTDPSKFLEDKAGDPALKSKMTFKLPKGGEDIVAYLRSVSPDAPAAQ